jgi:hypothetical protein
MNPERTSPDLYASQASSIRRRESEKLYMLTLFLGRDIQTEPQSLKRKIETPLIVCRDAISIRESVR